MLDMRKRALLWLFFAVALVISAVQQFSGRLPLQTDLLALLPATERNPVAEEAVNHLSATAGNRIFFLLSQPAESRVAVTGEAAKFFAGQLAKPDVLRQVVAEIPPIDIKRWLRFYHPFRFNLLNNDDSIDFKMEKVDLEALLQRKLYSPFRFGLSLPLADDPFGLTDNWLAGLPLKHMKLQPEDGFLVAREKDTVWVSVSALLPESAYDNKVQSRVATIIAEAESALHREFPAIEVIRTGTLFYADAARKGAEQDFNRIGTGSLIGLLLLLYLVFRSARSLFLGLLSVGFGILAAVVATIAIYGEIHLITLVFGASLIGEAIDYAIQYFAAHLGAGPRWQPMAGLRRVAPALNVALAASLLCYGALLLAPFPALSQIALFALIGLSCAWLTVFMLLPWLLGKPSPRDPAQVARMPRRFLLWWQESIGRKTCWVIVVLAVVLSLPGWLRLSGNDDIRLLISRPQTLVSQEERIRKLTGLGNDSQFYLVEGSTPEAVLANEEKLLSGLMERMQEGAVNSIQSIAVFVPSIARQQENRTFLQKAIFADPDKLPRLLAEAGLRDGIAKQLGDEFKNSHDRFITVEEWLQQPFSTPFRHLWLGHVEGRFASVVLLQGINQLSSLETIATGLEGVTFVDKPGSVSRLFQKYRLWGGLWFLGALCLVYGVLLVRYGPRQAVFVLLPASTALALTAGIFGLCSITLTLFNLMGFMLVLGVGVNYSIFLREGGISSGAPLAGVLLSAGTTLLSFGLLAFSSMPALAGFGLTLLLGISLTVLLSPMVLTFAKEERV